MPIGITHIILFISFFLNPCLFLYAKNATDKAYCEKIALQDALKILAKEAGKQLILKKSFPQKIPMALLEASASKGIYYLLDSQHLSLREEGEAWIVFEKNDKKGIDSESEISGFILEIISFQHLQVLDLIKTFKGIEALLSKNGKYFIDERGNAIILWDQPACIFRIRHLFHKMDIPLRQVQIEARIVMIYQDRKKNRISNVKIDSGEVFDRKKKSTRSFFELGFSAGVGLELQLKKLASSFLKLDGALSLLEHEGKVRILSKPILTVAHQQKAFIESGVELPYQENVYKGVTATAFKKAVLRLEICPRIGGNGDILLDLSLNQDSKGELINQVPAVNTQRLQTQILLKNEQMAVLGGIYTWEDNFQKKAGRGFLRKIFKQKEQHSYRQELLIFITPKLLLI